ncbi:MFS transporter [Glaciihabitans sp. dw_435]|uniref:MFS transporter n=1 Tax=Glaciihabitans sp. dw_435 TaxID=2720081 RepID=UPI001BD3DC32|nr:MFS transporter [Glaciihabitans sp. dw_435]
MYISVSDRPGGTDDEADDAARVSRRPVRVAPTVVALGFVSLFTDISSESVAAVLPLYITAALGLSPLAYGFLDGLYQGVSAIVRIAAGWASDRGDRPKLIALLGYGISMLARIALLFSTGLGAITAVVAFDRIGKGIRTAPRDAMITASSAPPILGRAFGVHRTLDTVGAMVGPVLAFVVLLVIPDGYSTVFVLSLACAIIGVTILGAFVPNMRPNAERAQSARHPLKMRVLLAPALRRLLIIAALFGLLTVGDGFIYLVLQSKDSFATVWFPLLYVGTNFAYLALAVPFGRLADRWGRMRVFVLGHGALLATYVLAALPGIGVVTTVACLLLLGVFYAATDGVLAALAARSVPAEATGSGIAAAQTVVALARFAASTGFGVLWFTLGRTGAITTVAIGLAVVLAVVVILIRRMVRSGPVADQRPRPPVGVQ